ncbi:Uncharacterised protein [Vibrio cholerae]|nr:Uncharacterised protein [Vibrio cholerae]
MLQLLQPRLGLRCGESQFSPLILSSIHQLFTADIAQITDLKSNRMWRDILRLMIQAIRRSQLRGVDIQPQP